MKNIWFHVLPLAIAAASCGGDEKDPETLTLDKLSPPVRLITVTGDQQVELRWDAQNYEDDFVGYYVFAAESNIDGLTAPKYPKTSDSVDELKAGTSVPRCADNNDFLKAFGIPATETKCERGFFSSNDDDDPQGLTANAAPQLLTTVLEDAPEAGIGDAKVECFDPAAADTSLAADGLSLKADKGVEFRRGYGLHRCLVKKLPGDKAVENGKTYTFFVVAVTKKLDEISWSSNLVEDTPAPAQLDAEAVTLTAAKYRHLAIDPSTWAVTVSDEKSCGAYQSAGPCHLFSGDNAEATPGITIARDNFNSGYAERVFISVPKSADETILMLRKGLRGNRDPLTTDDVSRAPGDEAESVADGYFASKRIASYGDEVIDFKVKGEDGKYHYGKVVIGKFTYKDPANHASDVTIPVTVIIQPDAENVHYFNSVTNWF